MNTVYLAYMVLSPDLDNIYSTPTHRVIWETLNRHFLEWKGFFKRRNDYDLSFTVTMKRGVTKVEAKGPDISRKRKVYHYAIYIPEEIAGMSEYVDFIFEGIKQVLTNFGIQVTEVDEVKRECKSQLRLS